MIVRVTEETRAELMDRPRPAQGAKGNIGVTARYRPFVFGVGLVTSCFDLSGVWLIPILKFRRPMRMRLKDHHLPTLSSRIVSPAIRGPKKVADGIRNTRRIET